MKPEGVLPPTYLFIGLIVMVLLHLFVSGPRIIIAPWRLIGIPVVLLAVWLTIYTDSLFKKLGTEIKPFHESSMVVTRGPYRFSRHPMYLGFMCILIGVAVLAGTLFPLLVVPVMFLLFTVRYVLGDVIKLL